MEKDSFYTQEMSLFLQPFVHTRSDILRIYDFRSSFIKRTIKSLNFQVGFANSKKRI